MNIKEDRKIPFNKLKNIINPDIFNFNTTEEIAASDGIIGQDRAVRSTQLGLMINKKGYNIYISGTTGTGKTSYARKVLGKKAKEEPVPNDICYVYNFRQNSNPSLIELPSGKGKEFKKDMEDFSNDIQESIEKAFSSSDYEEQKKEIYSQVKKKRQEKMQELYKYAEEQGFVLKGSNAGYLSIPILDGKEIDAETYENLDSEIKQKIADKSINVHEKAGEVIKKVQETDNEGKEKIKEAQDNLALSAIGHIIKKISEKYKENEKIVKYLEDIKKDILENINIFIEKREEVNMLPLNFFKKDEKQETLSKYKVNLLVDNSESEGAPVIFESNPTYHNLAGRIEYDNEMGVIITDYKNIKAGAIHRANGGYLILQARDVLMNPFVWEALKRVISTEELNIDDLREQYGAIIINSLKPEPLKVKLKIILIGSPEIYYLLYHYDEDFKKLFKIKADFDEEMDFNSLHLNKLAEFIGNFCKEEKIRHLDKGGMAKLVEYSMRLSGSQSKLATRFNELIEIVFEANAYAEMEKKKNIDENSLIKAIREKDYRRNTYQEKLNEEIKKNRIIISTEGKETGQINGLAVLSLGDFMFGKPSRITVSTFMGKSGIVNIERESKLSGKIHDKGVLILSGFMGEEFAQDKHLSFSANIVFEQLYGGIDGDSASSAELYALLSSLSGVAIDQGIAVTGSVNQKGEIQPIGGVTEKIEGFFDVCNQRGLSGTQGVIIPQQNIEDLVLKNEVIDAVKDGKFHIYSVQYIRQGIEILTGFSYEEIKELVNKKLQTFDEKEEKNEDDEN